MSLDFFELVQKVRMQCIYLILVLRDRGGEVEIDGFGVFVGLLVLIKMVSYGFSRDFVVKINVKSNRRRC